jgi:hypothetical protein
MDDLSDALLLDGVDASLWDVLHNDSSSGGGSGSAWPFSDDGGAARLVTPGAQRCLDSTHPASCARCVCARVSVLCRNPHNAIVLAMRPATAQLLARAAAGGGAPI